MSYEILITATTFQVSSSSTQLAVTVNAPATPTFTITNAVNSLSLTTLLNTASIYTDAVELVLADLNTYWKGQWTTGTYYRGDIVEYDYSQYFLDDWNPDVTIAYTSTVVPPNDSTWIRFNWHNAPFSSLTVTNNLYVGENLIVGGGTGGNGATFNGPLTVNNTATISRLRVLNELTYNGLTYPADKGLFGQVLYTNGVDKAAWVNLGELVFWSLSNNLYTNGFDIYTNALNQDLGIGVSNNNTFASSPSYAKFFANGDLILKNSRQLTVTATTTASFYAGKDLFFTVKDDSAISLGKKLDLTVGSTATITVGSFNIIASNTGSIYANKDFTFSSQNNGNFVANTFTVAGGILPSGSGLFSQGSTQLAGGLSVKQHQVVLANTGSLLLSAGPTVSKTQLQDAYIELTSSGTGATRNKKIKINGDVDIVATATTIAGKIDFSGDVAVKGSSKFTVSTNGITFSDGSTQTTAALGTSTFVFKDGLRTEFQAPSTINVYVSTATTATIGGVKIGKGLVANTQTAVLDLITATTTAIGGIIVGTTLKIDNTGTLNVTTASTATVGGVIVGEGLEINHLGVLNAVGTGSYIKELVGGTGTHIAKLLDNTATIIWIDAKRFDYIAGPGLTVTNTTTYISTADTYVSSTTYALTTATTATIGGIKIGNGIKIAADGLMSLSTATTSTYGGVIVGTGFDLSTTGKFDLLTATTVRLGGIIIGENLTIDSTGKVSAVNTGSVGNVDLTQDMNTNGWNIQYSQVYSATKLLLNTTTSILALNPDINLTLNDTTSILAQSPNVRVTLNGNSSNFSQQADQNLTLTSSPSRITAVNHSGTSYLNFTTSTTELRSSKVNSRLMFDNTTTLYHNSLRFLTLQDQYSGLFHQNSSWQLRDTSAQLWVNNDSRLAFIGGQSSISIDTNNYLQFTTSTIEFKINNISRFSADNIASRLSVNSTCGLSISDDLYTTQMKNVNRILIDNTNTVITNGSAVLTLDTGTIKYVVGSRTPIIVSTSTATISVNTATIGSSSDNSTLRVQRIYNYAGTFAPFFPAGVQFQDNTVQYTAFIPDQGLL